MNTQRNDTSLMEILLPSNSVANMQLADPDYIAFYQRLEDREYLLTGEIDSGVVNDLIHWIRYWNKTDNHMGLAANKRLPITILIDSPGGSTMQGMALHSVMKASKTPIMVVTLGSCASISIPIYLGATPGMRYAFENSSFLIHDGTIMLYDSLNKSQDTIEFNRRLDDRYMQVILDNTDITQEQYESKRRVEWWMLGDEALQVGLVDHLVTDLCEIERDANE